MNIQQLPSLSSAGLYNACEGSLYFITPSPSENMCINPSFEFDTTTWTSTGTITRVVSGYSGYYALQAVLTANQTVTHTLQQNPTAVQHAASIFVFHNGSTPVTINVQVADTITIANRSYVIPANQWTRVQVSFIGRNASTVFRIVASASCTLRLDACQIEVSSNGATTYFDGDNIGTQQSTQIAYPQYGWYGIEHKSASFRNRQATNGGIIVDLQQYGFQLISITGTGNPTFDNQIATYASTDGGILQDTVVPTREIAFLGRISGSNKTELHQRLQSFMSLFQRDQVSYYQPRSWKFHHKNGREDIGQEITFSAVLVSAVAADITDQLSVDVTIQLNMTDPYFYGHDIAQEIPSTQFQNFNTSTPSLQRFDVLPNYQTKNVVDNISSIPYRYTLGNVYCVYSAPDGFVYVSYSNSTIVDNQTGTTYNFANLARFNIQTNTWSAVTTANIFSTVVNPIIHALVMTPDMQYLFIGSDANGGILSLNRFIVVTVSTGSYTVLGTFNGTVRSIVIYPVYGTSYTYGYQFFAGGDFTTINGVARNRIAYYTTSWLPFTADVYNGDIYSMALDINPLEDVTQDWLIISGTFTTIGALNARRIAVLTLNPFGYAYNALTFGLNDYAQSIQVIGYEDWLIGGYYFYTLNNTTGANVSLISGLLRITNWNPTTSYGIFTDIGKGISFTNRGTRGPIVVKNGYLYAQYRFSSNSVSYLIRLPLTDLGNIKFTQLLPQNVYKFDVDDYGNIFFGQQISTPYVAYPKPVNFNNSSTASASLSIRMRQLTGTILSHRVLGVGNFSNNRHIIFVNGDITSTYPSNNYAPIVNTTNVVEIDSKIGIITSPYNELYDGSIILDPSSDLYTLVAMPGTNVIYVNIFALNTSSDVSTYEVVIKCTQTYQSLFDGVNGI